MKLGFTLPIIGPAISSAAGLSAFCRGIEDLGYDTLWVGDRLVQPVDMHSIYPGKEQPYPPQMKRYLDPVLLWTVAATATSRVRLNASTLSTFYYEPPHLARMLTTLDVLSDGRLEVGVGLGWMKDEHDISRSADWRRRGRMLDDLLAFLHPGWLGVDFLPDEVADQLWSLARQAAQEAGRDPDALKKAIRINLEPGTTVDSLPTEYP